MSMLAEDVRHRTLERIRWHCRRGMLELDLVLKTFVEQHLENLDPPGIEAFRRLLARPDPELLDLVMGRGEPENRAEVALVALMRKDRGTSSVSSY